MSYFLISYNQPVESNIKQELLSLEESFFKSAIESSKEAIYRICRIYAVKPLEPQDLFQEVLLQAWKSSSSFKGQSDIKTWLYRVALNVCMGSKLKLEKHSHQSLQLSAIQIEPQKVDEEDEERFRALKACINTLKEGERTLVILYLEALSYAEIGKVLGISENYVAVKMKRIRKKLFDCISKRLEQ